MSVPHKNLTRVSWRESFISLVSRQMRLTKVCCRECLTIVSWWGWASLNKYVLQRSLPRVSQKCVRRECVRKVSAQSVWQERPNRVCTQESPTRMVQKSVFKDCSTEASYNVLQKCPTMMVWHLFSACAVHLGAHFCCFFFACLWEYYCSCQTMATLWFLNFLTQVRVETWPLDLAGQLFGPRVLGQYLLQPGA